MDDRLRLSLLLILVINVHVCFSELYILSDQLERTYDGIGGLSGGGATSKLLVNYPLKQRNEILDYLFKPNFGASLQILKVEIGGDSQSTDGTEASHMHNSWEENYNRGYEWWLMKEAKLRNPGIKLYGLPWGFPGWLGQGTTSTPYKNPTVLADYIVRWILGAKRVYGLTIDYVGIWNERYYDIPYIKTLRKSLDTAGLAHTRIVAGDGGWDIANDVLKDSALASAVDYLGCHYPGTTTSSNALKTGKQLWASEDYSTFNDQVGGGCWARILNQNYVNGYMTSTISWNLIASYYSPLPFYRDGLMTAVEPWSGHYVVDTPVWVSAHTTQFTAPGWKYLAHGSGVGKLAHGGSMVSLASPTLKDVTVVIETLSHDHSKCIRPGLPAYNVTTQTITISLKGNFSRISTLNVWHSVLFDHSGHASMFNKLAPIHGTNGVFTLTNVGPDEVYTLTTLTTGQKGTYPSPPASQPFPKHYKDDFQGYEVSEEPYNLAPQSGSYEVVQLTGGNKVMRQTVLHHPVSWCSSAEDGQNTLNLIGDFSWTDVTVSVDFHLGTVNSTDGVYVAARVHGGGCGQTKTASGIFFFIFPHNNSVQLTQEIGRMHVFGSGHPTQALKTWNTITLTVQGTTATGTVNGQQVLKVNIPAGSQKNGFVALGTNTFGLADFDNFAISPPGDSSHPLFFQPKSVN